MDLDVEKTDGAGSSERRLVLLSLMLFISAGVHIGLMTSLSSCPFAPLPAQTRTDRKWTKERPTMKVRKMDVDPLSRMFETAPRPVAAPDAEKQDERVDRLAGSVERTPVPELPSTEDVVPKSAETLPDPAKVEAMEWKPRQRIAEIEVPTVPDEQAALARVIIPKVERIGHAADITPAFELMARPASVPAKLQAGALTKLAGASGAGPAGPLPPAADLPGGAGAADGHFGLAGKPPPLTVLSDAELAAAKKREAEKAAAERAGKTVEQVQAEAAAEAARVAAGRPVPPAPSSITVDEKVVEAEKKAVRDLRDERVVQGKPFEANVKLDLAAWVDPAHARSKYFRIRMSSRADRPLPVVSKDIVFLLDASGSIGNERLKSCRKAISTALRRLNTGDRFNVVAFRDRFAFCFADVAWKTVTKESLAQADDWMGDLAAHGQTDVFRTLRGILTMPRDPARPVVALVVTDGDATSGLTRSAEIVARFTELNGGLISVYMYGVKDSANRYLMDMVTRGARGGWACHSGLRWNAAQGIPELARKFERPVLSDVSVLFSASSNAETYPRLVTNLCEDEPIEIYGVCPASQEEVVFSMRGLNGVNVFENVFRLSFAAAARAGSELKTEWAQRRLHDMIAAYTMRPSRQRLDEMRAFAAAYRIKIPYEKEIK
ncbi:MAG: VWA domain-containing protein [Kiritimatiellia bacterium]